MDKEKNKSRDEGKDSSTDISPKAEKAINPQAFIRQIAVAGENTGISASQPASTQADAEQATGDVAVLENKDDASKLSTKEQGKRRKGQTAAIDYEAVFLARNELSNRQGLYIDRDNYEVLQTLVRAIRSERLSVSGLVDNIVSHHIELYGDEINRIFEENIRKPVK